MAYPPIVSRQTESYTPGVVYADMVDLVDKMAIFNYAVGGTRDLESFREGLDAAMGGLEVGEGVRETAE